MCVPPLSDSSSKSKEELPSAARNLIEGLGNLLHLIRLDACNSDLVHAYVEQANDRLKALASLFAESTGASQDPELPAA